MKYSQIFTLRDIFNNKELEGKLPLVNYKEIERADGSMSYRTKMSSVKKMVFDSSIKMARWYYKPLNATRSEDKLILDGNLIGDHNTCFRDIYDNLVGLRPMLSMTANNGDIVRSALKEAEKNKRNFGIDSKLYLRAQSIMQIKGMTLRQRMSLMDDIMGNILFGDDYPQTQKKYDVFSQYYGKDKSYDEMRKEWRAKVGL